MARQKFSGDVVIGLEIHVQLKTRSKLFCGCATKDKEDEEQPNSRTCEVCLGFPGSKPVLNKAAFGSALRLALALGCKIAPELIFSRKSYFYPDLAKNYQISQNELPLGVGGSLALEGSVVRIARVHIEEDPASLVHFGNSSVGQGFALIDYNRSGNPLCEVVTAPVMRSAEEAREFLDALLSVLLYLDIFDSKSGIIKADANISIRESGYTRVEIKNITGFKEIERALRFEVERQRKAVREGEALVLETRAWDAGAGVTSRMRTKETEADYGYILDPDLVPVNISKQMIAYSKKSLPELPKDKAKRFVKEFEIDPVDADVLTQDRSMADLFEKVAKKFGPSFAVRWLRHELNKVLNIKGVYWSGSGVDERRLFDLFSLVSRKKITDLTARELLLKLFDKDFSPSDFVEMQGLGAVSDDKELSSICESVLKENPGAVNDFVGGEEKSLNFLIGKVMRLTKGKADAGVVKDLMMRLILK